MMTQGETLNERNTHGVRNDIADYKGINSADRVELIKINQDVKNSELSGDKYELIGMDQDNSHLSHNSQPIECDGPSKAENRDEQIELGPKIDILPVGNDERIENKTNNDKSCVSNHQQGIDSLNDNQRLEEKCIVEKIEELKPIVTISQREMLDEETNQTLSGDDVHGNSESESLTKVEVRNESLGDANEDINGAKSTTRVDEVKGENENEFEQGLEDGQRNYISVNGSRESLHSSGDNYEQIADCESTHDKPLLNSKQIFRNEELVIGQQNNEHESGNIDWSHSGQSRDTQDEIHSRTEQHCSAQVTRHNEENKLKQKEGNLETENKDTHSLKKTVVDQQENVSHNEIKNEEPSEQKDSKTNDVVNTPSVNDNVKRGNIKLQTLADLICVCRSKGLQIFNNVDHRPESDKLLYSDADLNVTDDRGSRMSKRHRSDDRRISSRRKSQSTHRSKSVRSQRDDMFSDTTSGYHVTRGRLNTGTSRTTSLSIPSNKIREPFDRTTLGSRLSGRSGIDRKLVEKDVDSEELLQQRMWKRSKRRRDKVISLSDVVRERQKQIAAAAFINKLQSFKMADEQNDEHANSKVSLRSGDLENGHTNTHPSDKASVHMTNEQSNGGLNNENLNNDDGREIKEYKIQDGNTTLVLYNLKADKIKDEVVREKLIQECKTGQNGKMTDVKSPLISNRDCDRTESGDNDNNINSSSSAQQIFTNPKDDLSRNGLDQQEETKSKSSPCRTGESDDAMETKRRTCGRTTAKGTDSGLGSESERDSIKPNEKSRTKVMPKVSTGYKINRKNYGQSQIKGNNNKVNAAKKETIKRESQKHVKESKSVDKSNVTAKERKNVAPKEGQKQISKSRRSLGNGFLVSDDSEEVESGSHGTARTTRAQDMEKLYYRSKNINELPKQTRMMIIMAKIRERYQEEQTSQKLYLQQIQRARMELRGEYRNMKRGLGDGADGNGPVTDGSQADGEDTEAEAEVELENKAKVEVVGKVNHIVKVGGEVTSKTGVDRDKHSYESSNQKADPPKKDDEPEEIIAVDTTVSKSMKGKPRVMSKIDNRWSPEHKLYPMIKAGFKSNKKIPHHRDIQRYLNSLRQQSSCRDLLNSDTVTNIKARDIYLGTDSQIDNKRFEKQKKLKRLKSKRKNYRLVREEKYEESDDNEGLSREKRRNAKRVHRQNNLESVRETNETDNKKVNPGFQSRIPMPIWRLQKYAQTKKANDAIQEHSNIVHHNPKLVRRYSYNVNDGLSDSKHNHRIIDSVASANRASDKNYRYNNHVARRGQSTSNSTSSSQSRTTSSSTEIPMSLAVGIVKSRSKFYSESFEDEETPRGERIWQLYKDLQEIRQREPGHPGSNQVTGNDQNFLFMSYDTLNTPLWKQRTNRDFNKFLYGRLSYELCSKGRPLYMGIDRKEKALNTLKQKINSKTFLSANAN